MTRRDPPPARSSPPAARPERPGSAGQRGGADAKTVPKAGVGQRGQIAPPPVVAWESRLHRCEELVEQFRVDIERFWNGALPIPPEELKTRIQREMRELRGVSVRGAVDQFRLGTLEARFNSLSELYGRRLREREEGRGAAPPRAAAPAAPEFDPQSGIVFRGAPDAVAVEALWTGLVASGGGARIELETFRGYLEKQLGEIRTKTGVAAVQFRVVQEDGKLKLKARPMSDSDPEAG